MAKVRLTKLTIIKGNPYHSGVYDDKYLPSEIIKTPGLVTQLDAASSITPNHQNAIKKQAITIGTPKDNAQKSSYKTVKPVELELEKSGETPKVVETTNVNTATVDQISNLDGITMATANLVIKAREEKPFADLKDLSDRVQLKGNKKWDKFSLSFETEKTKSKS